MKTLINIKTDQNVKIIAQKMAQDFGLSLSAIINAYLKQFIRTKKNNFTLIPKMSKELEQLLGTVEYDIQRNRNLSKAISNKTELQEHFASL
ncbi:MAG: hypothetical protein V1768_02515 [Patescibacteria group bacterium]|nr:type II toxin-antitoxin system RelB/DinJ family antitoxin [Patescibacteria group bacterium]MBU1160622.1 type II toxin-antitoxin system RelB/DinJ family antitoxin [Patescibacteria group bacterium]MBU1350082.1 type II toxin-antitoxin system RelB/DinJ family antitoxin [Patescibacteria group bacterium]MBU1421261.1 type II toxin-antitoxin system RelB/DinJ family antitoxin [Patescibacteria group bacterium]MBU1684456.1 type II toxin-antitoxin system RelB/DinJ family antitoxin [Patescibacteria group